MDEEYYKAALAAARNGQDAALKEAAFHRHRANKILASRLELEEEVVEYSDSLRVNIRLLGIFGILFLCSLGLNIWLILF